MEHSGNSPRSLALALGIILGNQTIPSTESVLGGRVVGSSFLLKALVFEPPEVISSLFVNK